MALVHSVFVLILAIVTPAVGPKAELEIVPAIIIVAIGCAVSA